MSKESKRRGAAKIVVWGTGNLAEHFVEKLDPDEFQILFFVDNNKDKQGTKFYGLNVESPAGLLDWPDDCELLVLCMGGWRQVYRQAREELHVSANRIENVFLFQKRELVRYYEEKNLLKESSWNTDEDAGREEILRYLKNSPMDVFNYNFVDRYRELDIDVFYDESNGLYYILFHGKRMYMCRKLQHEYQVRAYCNQLFIEQDPESPHCYLDEEFQVEVHDVVLDAGTAEGNFALSVIDRVDRIYLVEPDRDWLEALKYTFSPYSDKVVFVDRFLGKAGDITIDELIRTGRLDFIKMDIEGEEVNALRGAVQTLAIQAPKLAVCAYHSESAAGEIEAVLRQCGYSVSYTRGFMVFIHAGNMDDMSPRRLVKGIVRGEKRCD